MNSIDTGKSEHSRGARGDIEGPDDTAREANRM